MRDVVHGNAVHPRHSLSGVRVKLSIEAVESRGQHRRLVEAMTQCACNETKEEGGAEEEDDDDEERIVGK